MGMVFFCTTILDDQQTEYIESNYFYFSYVPLQRKVKWYIEILIPVKMIISGHLTNVQSKQLESWE